MGGKSLRKCEVCGVRRRSSDIYKARFPLDPDRCRLWVKLRGNEDLAYLPIKRLNENKFICGKHFKVNAFNKKGNRLKRNAIPNLNLNSPLSDEILSSFPLTVENDPQCTKQICRDGEQPCTDRETSGIKRKCEVKNDPQFTKRLCHDGEQPCNIRETSVIKRTCEVENDRSYWKSLGEAYVQQWTSSG